MSSDDLALAPAWLTEGLRPKTAERLTITDVEKVALDLPAEERLRLDGYTAAVVARLLDRLRAMTTAMRPRGEGYVGEPWNQTTFDVACGLIEMANSPWSSYPIQAAYDELFGAAPRDPGFTDDQVNTIWGSAVSRVGDKARPVPDRPGSSRDWVERLRDDQAAAIQNSLAQTDGALAAGGPAPEDVEAAAFARDIAFELRRMRVRANAAEIIALERSSAIPVPPFDAGTLAEILARPEEPPARVFGLLPAEGSMLVVAQRKAGKTTLMLNLIRSLVEGTPFLNFFNVLPIEGNVAFLNYEVSGAMLGRWCRDVGIDGERMFMVNLRGRRNPLVHDRDELTKLLRKNRTQILIVDPFGRAYGGESQNDSGEVQKWLVDLDHFAHDIGATELVLSAHAGWVGERSRGASALEDWPDSIVTLVRDTEDETKRFIKAIGRDVELEEDGLIFDKATRSLRLASSGSRKAVKRNEGSSELVEAIVTMVADEPGLNAQEIYTALRAAGQSLRKGEESQAVKVAEGLGLLRVQIGNRGARLHYPTDRATSAAVCASCGKRAYQVVDGVAVCASCIKVGT